VQQEEIQFGEICLSGFARGGSGGEGLSEMFISEQLEWYGIWICLWFSVG